MAKLPNDVTLVLHQVKFPEETPGTTNGVEYMANFPLTRKMVNFTEIYLPNYMLGVFQVALCSMRCAQGSINQILLEWDPGPTYLDKMLWDPGGPSYRSRSHI